MELRFSKKTRKRIPVLCSLVAAGSALLMPPGGLRSDPLVIVRAMTATTVAEIYVEPDSVIVELEIGLADLDAFRNLMPDQIYERLGHEPQALRERLGRFFREDLTIATVDGRPLPGRVLEMTARPRLQRDEITGEPLPVQDEEAEPTVFAKLVYDLPDGAGPDVLVFTPPSFETLGAAANVGFVVYHRGVPVNDFRYLGRPETLRLDWSDPFYSRFDNRNLRRQNYTPISAYLYVEPYEVRREIVVRPKDLQRWVDLGLEGAEVIGVERQEEIKARVGHFLASHGLVLIDGQPAEGTLDRINFIYRTLRTSGVIDPPRDLDVYSATLGVIFVYPTDGLPEEVSLEWDLFDERIEVVGAAATDEAGGLPYFLTPGDNILRWQNFLTNPTIPGLVEVGAPPEGRSPGLVALLLVGLGGLGFLTVRHGRALRAGGRPPLRTVVTAAILGLIVVVALPGVMRSSGVSDEEAAEIIHGLLLNTYRAFDYREEDRIYDTLEQSISGELLTDVYLETRRSLELENQGGARAKVKEVEVLSAESEPLDGVTGFAAQGTWNVAGSVGHWGHIHQRRNQYEARFTIEAIDGVWKITGLEILQEERL
jgi:hypothetical protein